MATNAQGGLEELFDRVLRQQDALMAVIVAMTRDFEAAEEIYHNTVLEITRTARDRFDPRGDFARWAKGVARNMVMRHWASQKRRPVPMEESALCLIAEMMAEEPEPDAEASAREMAALRACLTKLSPRHRRLFVLRYGQDMKGRDLADKLGLSSQSLGTTLLRIRGFLRRCISRRLGAVAT
ncbi:MAG: sigma-70 family RNA polymerase sigma factor [Kiritimatiellae bacterium]|nr:sigma-70 family RNA polymerase sigma factor [Kiritimatiellia bacterium]